jgi:DnaJ-class molecular chaperone
MTETCPRCGGTGVEETAEYNDQYDRTHFTYDTCRECGGEGVIDIEEEEP